MLRSMPGIQYFLNLFSGKFLQKCFGSLLGLRPSGRFCAKLLKHKCRKRTSQTEGNKIDALRNFPMRKVSPIADSRNLRYEEPAGRQRYQTVARARFEND